MADFDEIGYESLGFVLLESGYAETVTGLCECAIERDLVIRQRDFYTGKCRSLQEECQALRAELSAAHVQMETLDAESRRLRKLIFARKSERVPHFEMPSGWSLLMWNLDDGTIIPWEQGDSDKRVPVKSYSRRKPSKKRGADSRKYLAEDTPIVPVLLPVPAEDRICCQCGAEMKTMKYIITNRLAIVPASAQLIREMREVVVCRECGHANAPTVPVVSAPVPPHAIPGGFADESTIALIVYWKYALALPYYRIEQYLLSIGIRLARSTMAHWGIYVTEHWLEPFIGVMRRTVLSEPVLQMDETDFQVLKEAGRSPSTKSAMIALRSGEHADTSLVVFHYSPRKSQAIVRELLAGYAGVVLTDGSDIYKNLPESIDHACCWAHARREWLYAAQTFLFMKPGTHELLSSGHKLHEIVLIDEPGNRVTIHLPAKQVNVAVTGFAYCEKIYEIEGRIKDSTPEERLDVRRKELLPLLNAFHDWLEKQYSGKTPVGKAVQYVLNRWDELLFLTTDGLVPVDNNALERSIRPFTVVRKNSLFADTPAGARADAALYSIVQTAKESDLDPYRYLLFLLRALPGCEAAVSRDIADTERIVRDEIRQLSASEPALAARDLEEEYDKRLARRIEKIYDHHYESFLPHNVPDEIRSRELVPVEKVTGAPLAEGDLALGRITRGYSQWRSASDPTQCAELLQEMKTAWRTLSMFMQASRAAADSPTSENASSI